MSWVEEKIVKVEPVGEITDIGAAAMKLLPPGRRRRYSRKLIYTLTDGRQFEGMAGGKTKPDMAYDIDMRQRAAGAGRYIAHINPDGTLSHCTIRL